MCVQHEPSVKQPHTHTEMCVCVALNRIHPVTFPQHSLLFHGGVGESGGSSNLRVICPSMTDRPDRGVKGGDTDKYRWVGEWVSMWV